MSRTNRTGMLISLAAMALIAFPVISAAADLKPGSGAKAAEQDPFRVPEGTVEELQKYIDELKNVKPSSSLRPAGVEFRRKRATAQLAACEKILAAKPNPEQTRATLRTKIGLLCTLERMGDATAAAKIEATLGEGRRYSRTQQAAAEQIAAQQGLPPPPPLPNPSPFVRDLQFLVLQGHAQQAATMDAKEFSQLVGRLIEFLKQGTSIDADEAHLAAELAMNAEMHQKKELAIETYLKLSKALAAGEDEKVKNTAATLLGASRRLGLIGKPFVLQGATLGGRPIDPKKYQGKVVLIDFFASWCGPCREAVPNIAKCYNAYRKRGFEVVAVSLDRDRKTIEEFLGKEKYPWTVLLDRYEARGTDKSLATYYGIFTIPQMILVGKDGKVIALDVHSERLDKTLAEILGPAKSESGKGDSGNEQASK